MRLNVVLVRSKYPRNIGMTARVLANYNLQSLILVDPQCDPKKEAAYQGAAEGQKPSRSMRIYKDWDQFYSEEQEGPRIAFSRREGKKRQSTTLEELVSLDIISWNQPTYFIFGSEDKGLSNEELQMTHRTCHFDLPGEVQSMNLSHAVLFALKSFFDTNNKEKESIKKEDSPIVNPEKSLRLWLETLNVDLETHKKWNALTVLQQMVLKSTPTAKEFHILDSLIQQTVRKLKEKGNS